MPTGSQRVNISSNLPNISVNCIQLSSAKNEAMYIGTDLGVFYKDSSSNSWESLNGNLPNVVVADIEVNHTQNKLVAATYGRGIWQTNLLEEGLVAITSLNPAQLSINNSIATKPVINYNRPIVKGMGVITIKENNEIVSQINVDSNAVTINGNQVEIDPGVQFKLSSTVDIEIPNGTFVDMLGYNVPAIAKNAWQFNIEAFVSVVNVNNDKSLQLFPNPVHQLLNVNVSNQWINSYYEIYDFTGKLVEKGKLNALQNVINTSQFQSGLYSLKLSKDQEVKTQYFMVNH
jgi:membrane-associated protease RseP (regulator of RpoE activity)